MTTADSHGEETLPNTLKNESLLYLMGELSPSQATEFEARLAEQPDLAEVLARQAEMISIVAESGFATQSVSTIPQVENRRRWPAVAALLAVAVCLAALVMGNLQTADDEVASSNPPVVDVAPLAEGNRGNAATETDSVPEALLIARAWAQDRTPGSSEEGMGSSDEGTLSEDETSGAIAVFPDAGDEEIDSTLSWMYIAVSSNLEEANDG